MLSSIPDAVVFTKRPDVSRMVTDVLRKKGVANVVVATSREECVDGLNRFARALLVLDWKTGDQNIVSVLSFNAKNPHGRQRPMMLLAEEVTAQLVSVCADYGVTQVYTEGLTPRNLGVRLTALLVGETSPDEVKRILHEASELKSGGAYNDAAVMLRFNLKKYPTNLKIKCELAETLLVLEENEEALLVLQGIDQTKPPYLRGIHLLGRTLLKLGNYEEALKAMEKSQLVNGLDADRLVDVGQVLLNMDRFKDARESFDKALQLEPGHRGATVGKGQAYLMDGAVNEALGILTGSTTDLELASIFNTCAVMSMRKGRHQFGIDLYHSALGAVSRNSKVKSRLFFNMGLGYRRWGKKEKALESLEKARSLDPTFKRVDAQIQKIGQQPAAPIVPTNSPSPEPFEAPMEDPLLSLIEGANEDPFAEVEVEVESGDASRGGGGKDAGKSGLKGNLEESLFGKVIPADPKGKKKPA
jgi:tetratricopeptide (TPR) repeat protein